MHGIYQPCKFWEAKIYTFFSKERERNINVRLPLAHPLLGTWPATQACALDWESNQWPFALQANPLSHTSQGYMFTLMFSFQWYIPSAQNRARHLTDILQNFLND